MPGNHFDKWLRNDVNFLLPAAFILTGLLVFIVKRMRGKNNNEDSGSAQVQENASWFFSNELPTAKATAALIRHRRTISPKDFTINETLAPAELRELFEAANWAPTHGHTEPWRFVVFQGPGAVLGYLSFLDDWYTERCDKLDEGELEKFRKKLNACVKEWPDKVNCLAIIVMKRRAKPDKLMPEWEELAAVSMSVQNLHLQATAMKGIGVFWSSHTWAKAARESKELKEYLGFEEEDKVLGALCIGRYDPSKVKATSTRGSILDKIEFRR